MPTVGQPRRRSRSSALAPPLLLIAALLTVAIVAPWLAPYDPRAQPDIVALKSLAPSLAHPFGTDNASRDVLSRVLFGARVSLEISMLSVVVTLCVGTIYGAVAALAGGVIDQLLMRALDVMLALPRLLWLLAISALWNTLPISGLILLLGLTGWFGLARLVRTEVQTLLGRDYVLAARAAGVPQSRLLLRHLLPHLIPILSVAASLGVAQTTALEVGLSFLGLGVQPPDASWGTIMQDGASAMQSQWWLTVFPGLATLSAVIACNWLGDALRDRFAPEQVPA